MLLPEIIFLSPHAYERMNAALLPSDDKHGTQRDRLDAAPRKARPTPAPATPSMTQMILRTLRASMPLKGRRTATR
jgi:hypothetical protein